ncbi:MAG: carbohydrate-binding family 9-like protein [Thermodesulfovibrionia bacterium]|nr:carbohydrate-binding family 9-like protein [Thermodesulfovibrionia bacterium]
MPSMFYKVKKLIHPLQIDANWEKLPWKDIQSALIQNHMGQKPFHFPKAEVKIAYDDHAIYAIFRVEDRYVRAVASEHQDSVAMDSCVEFFFTPNSDISKGYFNLEMNCGGTMRFHFRKAPGRDSIIIPKNECKTIRSVHSLPNIIDPEIQEPVTWTVEYRLPISLINKYCHISPPAPCVTWRANFYKCADNTSHPHWLTWALVDYPKPNFHLPQFFGILEFE